MKQPSDHIFKDIEYRNIILHFCERLHLTQRDLAEKARVHTSYFSRVMKGDANFSASQMFTIAQALGLEGDEIEFCMLVLDYQNSTEEGHRFFLLQKIRQCQKNIFDVKKRLTDIQKELSEEEVKIYYQEALTAKIHMHLTIVAFRQNVKAIAETLHIEEDKLEEELRKLEKLGLIKRGKAAIENVKMRIHLPEDHPLSKNNHMNWRLETIHKLNHERKKASDYHFSVVFSASEKEKEEIKARFKDFIVDVQKIVSKTEKVQKVYHLGFDLY